MTIRVTIEVDGPVELQNALAGLVRHEPTGPKKGRKKADKAPTEVQQKIIFSLYHGGECSMDALRARLDLSQGVILGNCRSLQRQGFVDIVDGMVSLAEKGQEYGAGL